MGQTLTRSIEEINSSLDRLYSSPCSKRQINIWTNSFWNPWIEWFTMRISWKFSSRSGTTKWNLAISWWIISDSSKILRSQTKIWKWSYSRRSSESYSDSRDPDFLWPSSQRCWNTYESSKVKKSMNIWITCLNRFSRELKISN